MVIPIQLPHRIILWWLYKRLFYLCVSRNAPLAERSYFHAQNSSTYTIHSPAEFKITACNIGAHPNLNSDLLCQRQLTDNGIMDIIPQLKKTINGVTY